MQQIKIFLLGILIVFLTACGGGGGGSTNSAPIATNDTANVDEDNSVEINVVANDSDTDGTLDLGSVSVTIVPSNGITSIDNTTGIVTYIPNTNYNGNDSFNYTIKDNEGKASNAATVSITVNPNSAPIATNDTANVDEDNSVEINVVANDSDTDGTLDLGSVSVTIVPSNGITSIDNTTGIVTYIPNTNYNGNDSFNYTIKDNEGKASNAATVSITVKSINDAGPTATNFTMILDVNESTVVENWKILSSAEDIDDDGLSATIVTQGNYGTFVVINDSLAYLKTIETNETDTGILEISDGEDSIQITVTLKALYWKQISTGNDHTVAIKSNGTLWAWGSNTYGKLGDGTIEEERLSPVQESTKATNWSSAAAGNAHTIAIKNDGTLWAWGSNYQGQSGNNIEETTSVPTQEITKTTNWSSAVVGSDHTIAIKNDGTLWAWGRNLNGQFGDGTTENKSVPTQEITKATDWKNVNAGHSYTVAIKNDGTLWAWGNNSNGQLGIGTSESTSVPTQEITKAEDWKNVSAGKWHIVALKNDGTLWAWGYNSYGKLGDGTITNRSVPTQENTEAADWNYISAGSDHTISIKNDGTLWAWGYNGFGQIGDGTTTTRYISTQESTDALDWRYISTGGSHTVALKSDGTLWVWGKNDVGQLGNGSSTKRDVLSPIQENSNTKNWMCISTGESHTVALKSDGTLWVWGSNTYGELGDGTSIQRQVPVQEVTKATDWRNVYAGRRHTVAIKYDGTLWAWGWNYYGQIGDGTTENKLVPTQEITGATDWGSADAGYSYTTAIKNDGTLWTWGNNSSGEFGDGTTENKSVPTQEITKATDWKNICTGNFHTVAIKNNGTLWAWGFNLFGLLGDGTTKNKSIPTQEVTGAADWSNISAGVNHTTAIKTDGTLWSWGSSYYGQLGDGTTENKSVPIQEVTGAADWNKISAKSGHTVAIKYDGTLWSWGSNMSGKLGDGTTENKSVPTQEVTGAADWNRISAGSTHTIAIKNDNSLWGWGSNADGQLGITIVNPTLALPRKP